jgi:hypothetical protein
LTAYGMSYKWYKCYITFESFFIFIHFLLFILWVHGSWFAFSKRNCGLPVCFGIIVNLGSKNGNSKTVLVQGRIVMQLNWRAFGTFVRAFFRSSSAFQRGATFLRDLVKNLSIRTWVNHCILYICM